MSSALTFLLTWAFDPYLAGAIVLAAIGYALGVHRINSRPASVRWPRSYSFYFFSALAVAWIVLLGPIGSYDDTFFWAHMVQHIALMMVVAPLLLLGAPVLLILRVSSRAVRHTWVVPVLHSRVLTWSTHPAVGWLAYVGVLMGTHFSPFYNFALEHPLVHDFVEHPLYLGAALIYLYPLLPHNPGPRHVAPGIRVLSLLSMMFPEAMTGFFIYASRYLLYPFYGQVDRPFGPGPIVDQQLGGALMWAGSMLIGSVWVAFAVIGWLNSEALRAQRINVQILGELNPEVKLP